jgi:hypothetical protein
MLRGSVSIILDNSSAKTIYLRLDPAIISRRESLRLKPFLFAMLSGIPFRPELTLSHHRERPTFYPLSRRSSTIQEVRPSGSISPRNYFPLTASLFQVP